MILLVGNVEVEDPQADVRPEVARCLGLALAQVTEAQVVRRSLDARHRKQVWRVVCRVTLADGVAAPDAPGVRPWSRKDDARYGLVDPAPERRAWPANTRVIVVGAGPAGLFAALHLAEAGAPVLLVDRGGPTPDRVRAVNGFWRRKLPMDANNNLLFGEGGAGTFSDGKIYTRRRDGDVGYILRRFVDFGARADILEEGWAHLGTDKVRAILPVFRARLEALGVEVRYHAEVTRLRVQGGRAVGVGFADGTEALGSHIIVAPGHSARDTVRMMIEAGAQAVARPIAIGARVEHPQAAIDRIRYGPERGDLPAASYRLAYHPKHGVKARTFCMCPGGMVVPAMNADARVVVNGMSFAAQRGHWANSAIIVEVEPPAYGGQGPLAGYAWQDAIEARAFEAGGGDFAAPGQRVTDFLDGTRSAQLPAVSYPFGARAAELREVLPPAVVQGMVQALRAFNQEMPGFVSADAVLMAPETRTTSPVRLLRGPTCESHGLPGLYPVGEGAGFGGGIVSCALDGLRAARGIAGGG